MDKPFGQGWVQTALWLLVGCLTVQSGCATSTRYKPELPFASLLNRSTKISPDASKEEIVAYLNQHVAPVKCWRSRDVMISATGMPIRLPATLSVQEPNQFRLEVSGPSLLSGQKEVDLGSNNEQVWFWANQMDPKTILTCKHEEISAVQNHFPIPVQPDWLMEVFCVKTVDAQAVDLIREPKDPLVVYLVSHHHNDQGQAVRRVSTVDLKRGYITGHQLYDSEHQLIASAELRDYRTFPNTTAQIPHDITLRWVQQDMKLNLSLAGVEVNPPRLPQDLWQLPQIADCRIHELRREHLLAQTPKAGGTNSPNKPRAVTQYELDSPSGVWLQNQEIVRPGSSAGKVSLEDLGQPTQLANHATFTPEAQQATRAALNTPPAAASNNSPYFTMGDQNTPISPVTFMETAPPFPSFPANSQGNSSSPVTASSPAVERRSRDAILIDGVPAPEFEPPVRYSSTNSQ